MARDNTLMKSIEIFDWLNDNGRADIVDFVQDIIDDKLKRPQLLKISRRPSDIQRMIDEIVDFYMRFVVAHQPEIREHLEYSWSCMSRGTIEDYLETVRERRPVNLTEREIEQVFRRHYGDGKFDAIKLEFIQDLLREAQYK